MGDFANIFINLVKACLCANLLSYPLLFYQFGIVWTMFVAGAMTFIAFCWYSIRVNLATTVEVTVEGHEDSNATTSDSNAATSDSYVTTSDSNATMDTSNGIHTISDSSDNSSDAAMDINIVVDRNSMLGNNTVTNCRIGSTAARNNQAVKRKIIQKLVFLIRLFLILNFYLTTLLYMTMIKDTLIGIFLIESVQVKRAIAPAILCTLILLLFLVEKNSILKRLFTLKNALIFGLLLCLITYYKGLISIDRALFGLNERKTVFSLKNEIPIDLTNLGPWLYKTYLVCKAGYSTFGYYYYYQIYMRLILSDGDFPR